LLGRGHFSGQYYGHWLDINYDKFEIKLHGLPFEIKKIQLAELNQDEIFNILKD